MKKLTISRWLGMGLLLAAFAGCGDDDDSTGGTGGGAGAQAMGGSTAKGGSASSSGGKSSNTGGSAGLGGAAGDVGGAGGETARTLTDAQIFLVLDTLNAGEVEQANTAIPRLTTADVGEFAQLMVVDHTKARGDVQALAQALGETPSPSSVEGMLKAKGMSVVAQLKSSQAESLDALYMATQVQAHAEALALLKALQATADAAELEQLLAQLQTSVQGHYEMAVTIEAALK
ncbi:MAG: DUF4142 domain-containing protein [Myxococcota bacterium]